MTDALFGLAGKRALVTGAGRGIGLAIARAYAERGADVTLCARSAADLDAAVQDLRDQGHAAQAMVADVTDLAAFADLIDTRPAFDVLVNNAGTNRPRPLGEITPQDYDMILGLNLRAAIFATQAVTRRMLADNVRGSVINMSSQMGHVGAANRSLYCASKWALEGFTKAAAIELGPHGIRVNTICPTFIETPMTRPYLADTQFRDEVLSKIRLGRLGCVDDIIGAAVYMASDASSLMTGSALMLDGGWSAG